MSGIILLSVPIFVFLGLHPRCDRDGQGHHRLPGVACLAMSAPACPTCCSARCSWCPGISGSKVSDMATVAPGALPGDEAARPQPAGDDRAARDGRAMADTVPPSIVLIVLGSVAGVSIAGLFTSGIAARRGARGPRCPGALEALPARGSGHVRAGAVSRIGRTLLVAAPALVLPFLIRSTVAGGVATATEVSTIAVLYALVRRTVLYRRYRLAQALRHARRDGGPLRARSC